MSQKPDERPDWVFPIHDGIFVTMPHTFVMEALTEHMLRVYAQETPEERAAWDKKFADLLPQE